MKTATALESEPAADHPGPLHGLRVLDLSWHVAGPYCTKLLSDFGADVIKVERPGVGDPARRTAPFADDRPGIERSLLFQHLNTGKRSVTLDMASPAGARIIRSLASSVDLVVENFAPGVLARLGLAPQSLVEESPGLVVASISNFGQTGPWRDYPANHLTQYALGGSMYIIGDPDREPLQGPGRQAEYISGLFAVVGALAAVEGSKKTGQGEYVDVSILEAVASVQENTTSTWAYSGDIWQRKGNRRLPYPMTILPCADGHVGVNAVTEQQWEMMLTMMDRLDLAEDGRFADGSSRLDNADALDAELSGWLASQNAEDTYHAAQSLRVPFGRVSTAADLLDNPQLESRDYIATVEHAEAGTMRVPGAPFRMPASPAQYRRAPRLGEHTTTVLDALGIPRADRERLAAMEVIS